MTRKFDSKSQKRDINCQGKVIMCPPPEAAGGVLLKNCIKNKFFVVRA